MSFDDPDEELLRTKTSSLLNQLTAGRLRRHHPHLMAHPGDWFPSGGGMCVRGKKIEEFRSFSFSRNRNGGQEKATVTFAFRRLPGQRWMPSSIHLDGPQTRDFRWNGQRWLPGRRRVGL